MMLLKQAWHQCLRRVFTRNIILSVIAILCFALLTTNHLSKSKRQSYGLRRTQVQDFSTIKSVDKEFKIHILWIGTRPLRPICLAALDSVARHMPHTPVAIHVTVEEGIPLDAKKSRQDFIKSQLNFFGQHGHPIELRFYDSVNELLQETPLIDVMLQQRHIGGIWNESMHSYLGAHATDLVRILLAYKEGGIFMDDDNILLHDLTPLIKTYGKAIFTSDVYKTTFDRCIVADGGLASGFFAVPKYHPFLKEYLYIARSVLETEGADNFMPRYGQTSYSRWAILGPEAVAQIHNKACRSDNPPIVVNRITPDLEEYIQQNFHPAISNITVNNRSERVTLPSKFDEIKPFVDAHRNHVVISRKYLVPAHWTEKELLLQQENTISALLLLLSAFQFHVFGNLKWRFAEYIVQRNYPLLNFIHQQSCRWMCNITLWQNEMLRLSSQFTETD